ncbi:MAG TPA: TIGR03435 family protein [Bryobacteraceae bacterium]|nr:TIGR03435 family protein [Bryobacteraceae bacterium]
MTRTFTVVALLALSLHPGHCQGLAETPAFEVASITPCKPGTPEPPMEHAGMSDFTSPGGRFTARATTLKFLLEWAYGIQPAQHSGGPSWMGVDRYDIAAKADGNAADDQMKLMVQTLLADRFQLKLHHERREISAYVISVGKTAPKLFPPKDGETHALRIAPQMGADQKIATYHIVATRYSLAQLADTFARQLGSVIVNNTGLDGEFDFTLDLTPDDSRPNPLDATLLIAAMREQLGLTLKFQKTAVDVLVIDNAEKVAAGN